MKKRSVLRAAKGAIVVVVMSSVFFRALPVVAGWNIMNTALQKRISAIGLGESSPIDIAVLIINTVLNVLALCTVVLILYAGFRWMFSRGNEEEITKAKGILSGAVLGLLVILASRGIMQYVFAIIARVTQ